MSEASSILFLLPATNDQHRTFLDAIIGEVDNGMIDLIALKIQLKRIKNLVEAIEKDEYINEAITDEVAKYSLSDGLEVTYREVNKYYYANCNDYSLLEQEQELERLKNTIKDRKEFLKSLTSEMVDEETGEIIKPPQYKFIKQLVVTLKK
jgi:hypothetical protein